MDAAVAQLAVVQIGLLGTLASQLGNASHSLSLALALGYLLLHNLSHIGMDVQEVVYLKLDEVANILVDALAARRHLQRAELNLGLALKHRFFHVDGYGSHKAVAYVGELVVLAEELLYGARYVLLEGALVGAALGGVLSVDKRVILLAILVGMCKGYLYVLALDVYDGVKRVGGHGVGKEVGKTIARQYAMTVVHDGKTRVEVGIVAQHRLHDVVVERVVNEERWVWLEVDVCAVLVVGVGGLVVGKVALLKLQRPYLAVSVRLYLEVGRESVDRLHTHTVKADALLERLGVVLAACVEHRHSLDELALRYTASVVAHRHAQTLVDVDLDAASGVHLKLVDRVVDYLLKQHVDAVLGQVAIAQTTDVHTGTGAHVLHVGEVADVVVGILYCGLNVLFFHFYLIFFL